MPRRLLDRCQPDSIHEFRLAARRRYDDALTLAFSGRRTASIYLLGYAAEMTLKAAYFYLVGLSEKLPITWSGHLLPAINRGRSLGIIWPNSGAGHNVRAWAELLIQVRASSQVNSYSAAFGREVQRQGQRIEQHWRETLRYHKNHAYEYELTQVRDSVEWYLVHSEDL